MSKFDRFQLGNPESDDHFVVIEDDQFPLPVLRLRKATPAGRLYRWDCFLARAQNQPPGFLAPFLKGILK